MRPHRHKTNYCLTCRRRCTSRCSSFWMILLQWINLLDYQLFPLNLHIWFTIIKPLRLVFSGSLEAVSSWKSISFPLQSWKFITYSQSVPWNVWIKSLNEFDSYRSSPVMTAHCNQLQRASMNDLQTDVRGRTSTEILWEDLLIVSVENKKRQVRLSSFHLKKWSSAANVQRKRKNQLEEKSWRKYPFIHLLSFSPFCSVCCSLLRVSFLQCI